MPIPALGTQEFGLWADSTAIDMRAYFEANRPLTWREWLFGRREYVESCVADDLMLGLLQIVLDERYETSGASADQPRICSSDWFAGEVDCDGNPLVTVNRARFERMADALRKIEAAPAWGAPERWETTPAEVRHLAREALDGLE
jgi:hypothetical protein